MQQANPADLWREREICKVIGGAVRPHFRGTMHGESKQTVRER
jgi:hypothetical protein